MVDDDLTFAEDIAAILVAAGHRADIATSAEDALVHFRIGPEPADALITASRLPGAAGIDLIRAIRSLGGQIPALILTTDGDHWAIEFAMTGSGVEMMSKPIDSKRLLSWVADAETPPSSAPAPRRHP